jgi:hypothetical protein
LIGRDAHLREECTTSMRNLVTNALQFDKENITYPKIGKEEVSNIFSFNSELSLYLQVHAALHEKMKAAAEEEVKLRGKIYH